MERLFELRIRRSWTFLLPIDQGRNGISTNISIDRTGRGDNSRSNLSSLRYPHMVSLLLTTRSGQICLMRMESSLRNLGLAIVSLWSLTVMWMKLVGKRTTPSPLRVVHA